MTFITDRSLGTLAKWLRLLGYDTRFYTGDPDRAFLEAALKEGRAVLTRKRELGKRQYRGRMLVLQSDGIAEQIGEVMNAWNIRPGEKMFFSRCLKCNVALLPLSKEKAKDRVPPYTYDTQNRFMICPSCNGIFWSGTHVERAREVLKQRIRTDRP